MEMCFKVKKDQSKTMEDKVPIFQQLGKAAAFKITNDHNELEGLLFTILYILFLLLSSSFIKNLWVDNFNRLLGIFSLCTFLLLFPVVVLFGFVFISGRPI